MELKSPKPTFLSLDSCIHFILSVLLFTIETDSHLYCLQTKLREGNVFTPVCHSVHGGVVYPRKHWAKGV